MDDYLAWQIRVYGRGGGGGVQRRAPKADTMKRIRASQLGRCLYCQLPIGARVKRNGVTVALTAHWDHFVPFSYLAQNPDANWVLSCQVCNGIKSDKLFQTVEEAREVILRARAVKGFEPTSETVAKLKPRKASKARKVKPKRKSPAKPKPAIQRAPSRRAPVVRSLPDGAVSHSCGAWWTGNRRSHCPGCCETFASERVATLHRIGEGSDRRCLAPEAIGLVAAPQPWGVCWEKPKGSVVVYPPESVPEPSVPPQRAPDSVGQPTPSGEVQRPDADDPWRPTRPVKPHRRTGRGGLTPKELALADDLHTRALAIRAVHRDGISIHEAVTLAALQLGLEMPRAVEADEP